MSKAKKTPVISSFVTLAEQVPLKSPLGIALSVGNVCDFKCQYCDFANLTKEQQENTGFKYHQMTMREFEIFANQLNSFEVPIKQLTFVSHGETLLNKNLPDMIKRIKEDGTAEMVKVTTNGNKLTHELSKRLIDAGLDLIKISIQGITEEKYFEICRTKVDLDKLREQIKFFYENKRQCKVYVKTLDVALEEGEEELFYNMFEDICDNIFIEQCFGNMAKSTESNKLDMYIEEMKICPMPFYTVPIDVMGNVTPCCRLSQSVNGQKSVIGNIFQKEIKDIWIEDFYKLQKALLKGNLEEGHICKNCNMFRSIAKQGDLLDNHVNEILLRYV